MTKKNLKKDINVKVDGYLFAANAITEKCLTVVANILHFHRFIATKLFAANAVTQKCLTVAAFILHFDSH